MIWEGDEAEISTGIHIYIEGASRWKIAVRGEREGIIKAGKENMKKCVISKCKKGDTQEGTYLKRSSVAQKSSKMKVKQPIGFEN